MSLDVPISMLRRLALPERKPVPSESCDFCSVQIYPQHRHLWDMQERKTVCTCDGCALRLENVIKGRFRLIPRESRALPNFRLSDAEWSNLALPTGLAFIIHNSSSGKAAAIYPSPAGAIESLLSRESWNAIIAQNPELENLKPDVEALLINRAGGARGFYIVPVDVCFELLGLVRKYWRGYSGGEKVRVEIETFFRRLREESARLSLQNPGEEVVEMDMPEVA